MIVEDVDYVEEAITCLSALESYIQERGIEISNSSYAFNPAGMNYEYNIVIFIKTRFVIYNNSLHCFKSKKYINNLYESSKFVENFISSKNWKFMDVENVQIYENGQKYDNDLRKYTLEELVKKYKEKIKYGNISN